MRPVARRGLLLGGAALLARPALAQRRALRFGVGPLLANPSDTLAAYTPIFAHLARALDVDFDLKVTADWAGMAVAMGSGQLDVAWMGPWGYVIANNATNCQAVATAKYDEKPVYQAIVVARPDLDVTRFPDSTRGLSISFADVGSTSGWLVPTYYAKEVWHIDPRTFWQYREGASHPANEVAVSSGQVDLATDYDRNRTAMIESGRIKPDATKIVWTSDPLPNDAIVLPDSSPAELRDQVRSILTALTPEQARSLLPPHYTGFVPATHATYETIEKAGLAVGKIKRKA